MTTNKKNNEKFPVCFQAWEGQTSTWYWSGVHSYREDMDDFNVMLEKHAEYKKSGNTIARLYIFNSQEELNASAFV